jgi:hypothetical protein
VHLHENVETVLPDWSNDVPKEHTVDQPEDKPFGTGGMVEGVAIQVDGLVITMRNKPS